MQLLLNEAIYQKVIVELLPQARKFLWIVTADIKDLHVPKGRRFVPLLERRAGTKGTSKRGF